MPELPEVETTKLGLIPYVVGQVVSGVNVYQRQLRHLIPEQLGQKISGQIITSIERRAKYLCFYCPNGLLIIHLGMSGSLKVVDSTTQVEKHDHFELLFANKKSLRLNDPRRFGAVLWSDVHHHTKLENLGPEPLTTNFSGDYLIHYNQGKSKSIKAVIMDNKCVVGIGNIYACESLFKSGINPQRKANSLNQTNCDKLTSAIKTTLKEAIKCGGTTLKDFTDVDGKAGYFKQQLQVYGQNNQNCPNDSCSGDIKKIKQLARSTYYCPKCQK